MTPSYKRRGIDCICTQQFCESFPGGFSAAWKCLKKTRTLNMRLESVVGDGCVSCAPGGLPSLTPRQNNAHRTFFLQGDGLECACSSRSCCPPGGHNWDKAPKDWDGSWYAPPAEEQTCLQSCSRFRGRETLPHRAPYAHDLLKGPCL